MGEIVVRKNPIPVNLLYNNDCSALIMLEIPHCVRDDRCLFYNNFGGQRLVHWQNGAKAQWHKSMEPTIAYIITKLQSNEPVAPP